MTTPSGNDGPSSVRRIVPATPLLKPRTPSLGPWFSHQTQSEWLLDEGEGFDKQIERERLRREATGTSPLPSPTSLMSVDPDEIMSTPAVEHLRSVMLRRADLTKVWWNSTVSMRTRDGLKLCQMNPRTFYAASPDLIDFPCDWLSVDSKEVDIKESYFEAYRDMVKIEFERLCKAINLNEIDMSQSRSAPSEARFDNQANPRQAVSIWIEGLVSRLEGRCPAAFTEHRLQSSCILDRGLEAVFVLTRYILSLKFGHLVYSDDTIRSCIQLNASKWFLTMIQRAVRYFWIAKQLTENSKITGIRPRRCHDEGYEFLDVEWRKRIGSIPESDEPVTERVGKARIPALPTR